MTKRTKPQLTKNPETLISKQQSFIVLTQQEQHLVKGGFTCSCNEKRIKRRYDSTISII